MILHTCILVLYCYHNLPSKPTLGTYCDLSPLALLAHIEIPYRCQVTSYR